MQEREAMDDAMSTNHIEMRNTLEDADAVYAYIISKLNIY